MMPTHVTFERCTVQYQLSSPVLDPRGQTRNIMIFTNLNVLLIYTNLTNYTNYNKIQNYQNSNNFHPI